MFSNLHVDRLVRDLVSYLQSFNVTGYHVFQKILDEATNHIQVVSFALEAKVTRRKAQAAEVSVRKKPSAEAMCGSCRADVATRRMAATSPKERMLQLE